jgi:hypothetical protein
VELEQYSAARTGAAKPSKAFATAFLACARLASSQKIEGVRFAGTYVICRDFDPAARLLPEIAVYVPTKTTEDANLQGF